MEYLGIDWSHRRAVWCSLSDAGVIVGEGAAPADADGLARLSEAELWVPSVDDRALRERLRTRMHLVRMRVSAMNRIFGLPTQWGLRISL